jgi:hypothetical protein
MSSLRLVRRLASSVSRRVAAAKPAEESPKLLTLHELRSTVVHGTQSHFGPIPQQMNRALLHVIIIYAHSSTMLRAYCVPPLQLLKSWLYMCVLLLFLLTSLRPCASTITVPADNCAYCTCRLCESWQMRDMSLCSGCMKNKADLAQNCQWLIIIIIKLPN